MPLAVVLFALAAAIAIVPAGFLLRRAAVKPPAPAPREAPEHASAAPALLFLQSSRAYQSDAGDFWFVDGEIRNLTNGPLRNVEAVATWLDRDGLIVATDGNLIDFKRLMPGEASRFRTITRTRPGMAKFELRFRYEDGKPLALRDDSHASSGELPPPQPMTPLEAPSTPGGEVSPEKPASVPASVSVQ